MKSKLIPIAYTVGIIKPNLALKDEKVHGKPARYASAAVLLTHLVEIMETLE